MFKFLKQLLSNAKEARVDNLAEYNDQMGCFIRDRREFTEESNFDSSLDLEEKYLERDKYYGRQINRLKRSVGEDISSFKDFLDE